MFCLPDERSPLRQLPTSGRIYLFIVCTWLAVVILASIQYELTKQKMRRRAISNSKRIKSFVSPTKAQLFKLVVNQDDKDKNIRNEGEKSSLSTLCEALSVHNSLKRFKSNSSRANSRHEHKVAHRARVNLACLDFFKISSAILIVLGHSIYLASLYTRSLGTRVGFYVSENNQMFMSIGRLVDTFFMLFGLLLTYTMLRKFTPNQLANPLTWIMVNVVIFTRIGPIFMLIYWYCRSLAPYTSSGPWWDYGVYSNSFVGRCIHEPWWKSIPYFSTNSSCVPPGWFIVSYLLLALIAPLITYLMYKLPNNWCRLLLIVFATALGGAQLALKMYSQVSFKHEAFTLYGGFIVHLLEKFESTGTMATLGKVGTVSIGCFVGYLLRMYEIGAISEWPRWFSSRLTTITAILVHVIIFLLPMIGGSLAKSSGHIATMNEFLGSYLVAMIIWTVANAFVLINVTTINSGNVLVRFTSHTFWHVFNKLGLCIFLIHWEIISFATQSYEQGPSLGFFIDGLKLFSFGLVFAILLSLLVHILFEAPLSAVLRLAMEHATIKSTQSHRQHKEKSNKSVAMSSSNSSRR